MGSSTIAVRFVLGSGNVDFYDDEIWDGLESSERDIRVMEDQTAPPVILLEGDALQVINISIIERYSTTKAKVDLVIDEKAQMTIYPHYAYDNTDSCLCIFYPNGRGKTYSYVLGEKQALRVHRLTFLQSN